MMKSTPVRARIMKPFAIACAMLLCLLVSRPALPHGTVGNRFLPTTLAVEDPFAQDELSFVFGSIRERGNEEAPSARENELAVEYGKRITPNFALSLEGAYVNLNPNGEPSRDGFSNLEIAGKWQFFTDAAHETVLSLGLGAEIGDTGNEDAEAEDFSLISPAFFFAKGFGDLGESSSLLRPLAITGAFSADFPTESKSIIEDEIERNPVTLNWGLAFLYDLHYLQTRVRDVGLEGFAGRLVPTVEVGLNTCLNRGCGSQTSGTVNPGLIYVGRHMQFGLEAQIPVNNRSGKDIGVLFQIHFFLDDLFSNTLGRPLFGRD